MTSEVDSLAPGRVLTLTSGNLAQGVEVRAAVESRTCVPTFPASEHLEGEVAHLFKGLAGV